MGLRLDIVTPERELFTGEVDSLLVPSVEGQMGILPHHAPLIAVLTEGELVARRGEEELFFAVHGGTMQVLPDRVIVLADAAERADDIDEAEAEAARQRAEELLKKEPPPEERAAARDALRRSLAQLKTVRHRRAYRPGQDRSQ